MPEQKDVPHPASERAALPTRQQLLAADKEELIERVESLARELQRRVELEEEILHLNFQKGTASLQAQVEEASRRFRVAQQEIEAFRAEILGAEEDPGRTAPRPFVFENLEDTPSQASDPGQLLALLTVFRRLRGDRDRLLQEADRARGEAKQLRESLNLEQEKSQRSAAESARLGEKLADLERRLKEALTPATAPAAPLDGYELLQKFFQKARLKELLEKHVPGQKRAGQLPVSELLVETVAAIMAAPDRTLEAAKHLPFTIVRPPKKPELAELRQFLEELPAPAVRGLGRVHDLVRSSLTSLPKKPEGLTVDLDSLEVVIDCKPRPHLSYWPLICFVPGLREFWQGELRFSSQLGPGDTVGFLSGCLSRMPSSVEKKRVCFRMDARFFSEPVLRLLEAKRCAYVVAAPDSSDLRSAARLCAFSELSDGWEAGECLQRIRATQARFVVLRRPLHAEAPSRLPFLFRDPQHQYHVFAVDKGTSPSQALQCYAGRSAAEESEHSLLRDFCVNRLLGRGPRAHANCFQLYLLASNLLQWFRAR